MFRHRYEANYICLLAKFHPNSSGAFGKNNKTKQKNMKAKREKLLSFVTSECKKKECKNHYVSLLLRNETQALAEILSVGQF